MTASHPPHYEVRSFHRCARCGLYPRQTFRAGRIATVLGGRNTLDCDCGRVMLRPGEDPHAVWASARKTLQEGEAGPILTPRQIGAILAWLILAVAVVSMCSGGGR